MGNEAQIRANEKYRKKAIKSVLVRFFPKDHELHEKLKEKGKEYEGGISGYIRDLVAKDLNIKTEE